MEAQYLDRFVHCFLNQENEESLSLKIYFKIWRAGHHGTNSLFILQENDRNWPESGYASLPPPPWIRQRFVFTILSGSTTYRRANKIRNIT